MDLKMVINRLEKEELSYELSFRGVTGVTTVSEMRKSLRNLLKLERQVSDIGQMHYPSYPFSFSEDITYVREKIKDIEGLIKEFADVENSPGYDKIATKIVHIFRRATRAVASQDDDFAIRQRILLTIMNLQSDLKSRVKKIKKLSRNTDVPVDLSILMSSTTQDNNSDTETSSDESHPDLDNAPASSPIAAPVVHEPCHSRSYVDPVYKWNIVKFDGEKCKISLCAFLEQIEEFRVSRNVSNEQLFKSAGDLFAGKAKIWYSGMKNSVKSWEELVKELRIQYLGSNAEYNKELLKEIRRRTQHAEEPIGIYLACMNTLFNRLTVPVTESARLEIVLDNLAPYYKRELGMVEIRTLDQLLQLGRKAESNKRSIESYVPPPRHRNFLEPDLAYVYSGNASPSTSAAVAVAQSTSQCWNCREVGHLSRHCPSPVKNRYCFRCGNADCTVRTCSRCNSGNMPRRH